MLHKDLLRLVRPYTVIDDARLTNLVDCANSIWKRNIPGDIVECGVAQGGSAALLAAAINRHCYLYDSFQGLPQPTVKDGPRSQSYAGANAVSSESVKRAMQTVLIPEYRYTIHEGWYPDSFFRAPGPERIALLHIDADWYKSVGDCLEFWYPLVSFGGIVILDDFGFWPGCRAAFYEFVCQRQIVPNIQRVSDQIWWIKEAQPR